MESTAALRAPQGSSAPLGVGIVGGGFMAEVHSRAARAARGRLIGAVGSSPIRSLETADLLGVDTGLPLLLVHRTAWDAKGQPVEWTRSLFRGDRFRFVARHRPDDVRHPAAAEPRVMPHVKMPAKGGPCLR